MRNCFKLGIIFLVSFMVWGCSKKKNTNSNREPETIAQVKVTHIHYRTLADTLTVNGQVKQGERFTVRAPLSGYITKVWVHSGENVKAGQRLFTLRTREQEALSYSSPSDSLPKPMNNYIKAPVSGQITSLAIGSGVYTSAGSPIAMMISNKSIYLRIYVPLRWSNEIQSGDPALVQWADGQKRWAKVGSRLVQADTQSQSEMYIIDDLPTRNLLTGERLNVLIPVHKVKNVQVLPNDAVLTDQSMKSFWVMKLINDSTAVRVNVTTGLSTNNWTAVTKPRFTKNDRILVQGNYGLADTARVKVVK